MFSITDYLIIVLGAFFLYKGWKNGFFYSILGPFCLSLSIIAALFYYIKYQNILITFFIGLIGPFILSFILSGIIKLKNKALKKKSELSRLSRFLGSLCYFFSRSISVMIIMILIMLIPGKNKNIQTIQQDISPSRTYQFLSALITIPAENIRELMALSSKEIENMEDMKIVQKVQSIKEYSNLLNNPNFKNFIEDQEVIRDIKNKDMGKLLMNPKMKSLLEDKNLMKNVLEINKELFKKDLKGMDINDDLLKTPIPENHLPIQN